MKDKIPVNPEQKGKHQPPVLAQNTIQMAEDLDNLADHDITDQLPPPPQLPEGVKMPNQGGAIIGSYRITKTLGQGTFGKVKEGVHVFTNQKVAIKILEKNKITDVNDVERVTREIHILKIVNHPNIIQLYEIIETPCRLFLIMEHCCNGELFSYITSKNKLKEEESCRLFQQLIAALEYLGRLGIVHRDVKPENLLLDEQLNLKVVDFGLSNTFKPGEKLATACGSPCYAAPELIKGLEYMGPKADLWSAGVVLYTLVCGHLPFEDNNTQSLYQKILSADYKFTCYLSREVRNLIENILVPDPELRYGLKQITSNSWFKNAHAVQADITTLGRQVGQDSIKIYGNVLAEMALCEDASVDIKYARICLMANRFNAITAHYYLLMKRKMIEGQPLIQEKVKNGVPLANDGEVTDAKGERINYHLDPSQRALIAAGRQTKKYQSIEPQRTTLYNEKNKYQLRKIAEGLHDFSNIKRITAPDNSIAEASASARQKEGAEESYINTSEMIQSPLGASGALLKEAGNKVTTGGSGSATGGQKFLFSPTLTDEAEVEEDDDYLLSQQKSQPPQGGPGGMVFSPTGARTASHFRQFPISPKTATASAVEKAPKPIQQQVTSTNLSQKTVDSGSHRRPFGSSSGNMTAGGASGLANQLLTSDDQANQIFEMFESMGEQSSGMLAALNTTTIGDMLNRPNTGFELFGRGDEYRGSSVGVSPTKLSANDTSLQTMPPGPQHMSVLDFLSDKILPQAKNSGQHARNRNSSSYQLEQRHSGGGGSVAARPRELGGSGGVVPGNQPYKRKLAYGGAGGSHQKTKKKTSRGEQYSRKASSNLDFLQKGSTITGSNQNTTMNNNQQQQPSSYARPGGQNNKLFDQQIRQILNQSQIVESANSQMMMIESGAETVGASDLRKMTSQLSKQMPQYSRISAMSNYNTASVRASKNVKTKVRGSHSGAGGPMNQTQQVQHGLLSGLSTGVKIASNNGQRKTLRSTRENLEQQQLNPQKQQSNKIGSTKPLQHASIPAQNNNLRKGSMSIISPSQKVHGAGASSGETQNTRLISSGSHIQTTGLNKTTSNIGQQLPSNSTTKAGKGSKKTLGNGQAQKQSKIDQLNKLDKEISLTFQQYGNGKIDMADRMPQMNQAVTPAMHGMNNTAVLSSLVSPNNQAAAHYMQSAQQNNNQNPPQFSQLTSPLNMIQSPGMNRINGLNMAGTIDSTISGGNHGLQQRPTKVQSQGNSNGNHNRTSSAVVVNANQQKRKSNNTVTKAANNNANGQLNPYLIANIQSSGSKHRNARASSTVAYASATGGQQATTATAQRGQQLSDFIVPSQFVHQQATMQPGGNANPEANKNVSQTSRNMHARAMTSLGTSSAAAQQLHIGAPMTAAQYAATRGMPPSIISPATTIRTTNATIQHESVTQKNGMKSSSKPPNGTTNHKRGHTTMMATQQPASNTPVLRPSMKQNGTFTGQPQTIQAPTGQVQLKPSLKLQQQQITTQQSFTGSKQRPPSARRTKPNQTPNAQQMQAVSALMSPVAAQMLAVNPQANGLQTTNNQFAKR